MKRRASPGYPAVGVNPLTRPHQKSLKARMASSRKYFDVIDGKREQFLGKLQERQGIARDVAEKQLSDWQARHPDFRFND